MFTTIINVLFSASLFITGGHVLSSNLKLHHYTDKDYEEIWHLKNKTSISVPLFIVGSLIFLGILDTSFYYQADNMMTGLLEYQREGVGLLLGSFWIYLQKYL